MENKTEEKAEKVESAKKEESPKKYLHKKRLIKRSVLIKRKEIVKKNVKGLFDKEAELGSDNEEHDDVVKVLSSDDEKEEENSQDIMDMDVPNLINDNIEENDLGNSIHKEKYIDDMLIRDKEEIKKVIEGPPERKPIEDELIELNEDGSKDNLSLCIYHKSKFGFLKEIISFIEHSGIFLNISLLKYNLHILSLIEFFDTCLIATYSFVLLSIPL